MFGVVLSLCTGLRIGELLALTWSDIGFRKGLLFVSKTCHDSSDCRSVIQFKLTFCEIFDIINKNVHQMIYLMYVDINFYRSFVMKNGYLWRGVAVIFLTVGICSWLVGIESVFLLVIIGLASWGLLELLIFAIKSKKQAEEMAKTGIIPLTEQAKKEKKEEFERDYNATREEALQTPKQRYKIDFDAIQLALDLCKGLAMNDVQTGIELQTTDAPKADWAIAGGLASGLAGGFAGAGAALDTMRQNAEATERQHERGRKLVEQGLKRYQSFEDSEKAIMSETYDDFTCSEKDSKLINELKVELDVTDNYGVGYIRARVKISAGRNYTFPGSTKKAVIDGSVRVDLYDKDGIRLMASGYYCPPGRYGNDRTKTGFGLEGYKTITLKEYPGVSFNKHNGCQVKLSNPNLWLLQL